jgi:PhzF family phenazine biosynthesis protein
MVIQVPIVNAFIDGEKGGNPAGVVLDAERFSTEDKQRIAAAVGLSETAFVSPSTQADVKLEFFTPTQQIAHCGHATVAAFSYLQQTGRLDRPQTSKETIDGRREILMEGASVFMEQRAPHYEALESELLSQVLRALRIDESDLIEGTDPYVVNTGNSFLVIGLKNPEVLKGLKVDQEKVEQISHRIDALGFYAFSLASNFDGRDAGARMFAPRIGIEEESATGMAAGPLACYLYDKLSMRKQDFYIEQGHWMPIPSPSLLSVRLNLDEGRKILGLFAGGRAEISEMKTIEFTPR